jgi:multisubunit Na+/H+ antiporter MnhF subunit
MEGFIPQWVIDTSMFVLSISALLCLYCIVRGPTLADRILSSDAFGVCVIGSISIYSLNVDTVDDLSAVLMIAILGFIGLIVVAKYIGGGGDVIDRE